MINLSSLIDFNDFSALEFRWLFAGNPNGGQHKYKWSQCWSSSCKVRQSSVSSWLHPPTSYMSNGNGHDDVDFHSARWANAETFLEWAFGPPSNPNLYSKMHCSIGARNTTLLILHSLLNFAKCVLLINFYISLYVEYIWTACMLTDPCKKLDIWSKAPGT